MQLGEVLQKTKTHFDKLGGDSSRLDAELLLSSALGWKRLDIYLKTDYPLSGEELEACRELVRRRSKGEPVAYILGEKDFFNVNLKVTPDVLIPRPETEHIVDEVIAHSKTLDMDRIRLLDLGTGSGCIALASAKEIETLEATGLDISPKAVELAKINAKRNELSDRVSFLEQDVCALSMEKNQFSEDRFDILTANPPYISEQDPEIAEDVKLFEPHIALFAEEDGLSFYRSWVRLCDVLLKPSGVCLFEIGHRQAKDVVEIFNASKLFQNVEVIKDYSHKDRVVKAIRK
ncbi:MAG: peptide chain release factor N(5)-glutamine methyltransferase [Bdellovibrionales bacterium]